MNHICSILTRYQYMNHICSILIRYQYMNHICSILIRYHNTWVISVLSWSGLEYAVEVGGKSSLLPTYQCTVCNISMTGPNKGLHFQSYKHMLKVLVCIYTCIINMYILYSWLEHMEWLFIIHVWTCIHTSI